jgi:glycosyltransferase involved in cell wall biosynthesis
MKLVMFTPGLRTSAIGRMACIVVRELVAKGVEVTIVRCEAERFLDRAAHAFNAPVIEWTDEVLVGDAIAAADLVVYHFGDNFGFHQGAIEWLERVPGVVCLHDFYLGHLFHGWARSREAEGARILRSLYGDGADVRFFAAALRSSFIAETADMMPCTEWICAMASAVVTHSSWGIPRVLESCPGPVRVVPLAYETLTPGHVPGTGHGAVPGQMRLLTVGHANPNKRLDSVIRAIGGSPWLRANTVYRHVGHMDTATLIHLSALASGMGVDFVVSGELDDAGLEEAFGWANVVSCLRTPSLESASASAIESMLYGKAIIVSDGGFYAEIESSCAVRINSDDEIASLLDALEGLARDPAERDRVGSRAREWAERTFRADNYASELMDLDRDAGVHPAFASATSFFFNTLARWGGDSRWLTLPPVLDAMAIFDTSPQDAT